MAHVSADERREDLISAAFRVMVRKGVSAASTRAICAEAGVPQSVFHYCYRSKEELLRELTQTVVSEMTVAAFRSEEVAGGTVEETAANVLKGLLQSAMDSPERQLVLYELTTTVLRDPELSELAEWQYGQYYLAVAAILDGLANKMNVTWSLPMPVLARLFTTFIDGLILNWLADRNTEQVGQVLLGVARQIASFAIANESVAER